MILLYMKVYSKSKKIEQGEVFAYDLYITLGINIPEVRYALQERLPNSYIWKLIVLNTNAW